MMIQFICVAIFSISAVSSSASCRNSQGALVDWFVGYKLPILEGDPSAQSGLEFLYADGDGRKWKTAEFLLNINSTQSAIALTLQQLYSSLNDAVSFYLLYNDEHPDNGKTDSYRAHAKGVIVFNGDSGFWLIHSVPNFPPTQQYAYPSSGHRNGQSFLCITMKASSLKAIAKQMLYIQPSIYLSQLPSDFSSKYPDLQKVIDGKSLSRSAKTFSSIERISSKSGKPFTSFAKHKKFKRDLYADLVAQELRVSLFTETWMNGPGDLPSECSAKYKVNNILSLKVNGEKFTNSKDHSKWAIGVDRKAPFLCIGDINRQKSQMSRGGGTMCMRNRDLWSLYKDSVVSTEQCTTSQKSPNWLKRLWKRIKGVFGRNQS